MFFLISSCFSTTLLNNLKWPLKELQLLALHWANSAEAGFAARLKLNLLMAFSVGFCLTVKWPQET